MGSWRPSSLFHFPALPVAAPAICLSSRAMSNRREMLWAGGPPTQGPATPLVG